MHSAQTTLSHLLRRRNDVATEAFFFTGEPLYPIEEYTAYLPAGVHFRAPFDGACLRLVSGTLAASAMALRGQLAELECDNLLAGRRQLLDVLANLLEPESGEAPDLAYCADALATSPATLKRRLQEMGLSFQEVLDGNQRQRAITALLLKGYSIEAVSELIQFHDSSNFRRAFKRWIGMTPSRMKATFNALAKV